MFDRLMGEIRGFTQHPNETLVDAWIRMKDLLHSCHEHSLRRGAIIQIFYHGLDEATQAILDAEGIFLYKTPNETYQLLENHVLLKLDWSKDMKAKPNCKTVTFVERSNDSKLMENMEAYTNKIDSQFKDIKGEMKDMQDGCNSCRGSHPSSECNVKNMGGPKHEEANYGYRGYRGGGYQGNYYEFMAIEIEEIPEQEEEFKNSLEVLSLEEHKEAFAWKTSDIPRISPFFCKHKINFEDDANPIIQRLRRLNPNMKEVMRKDIIKLLDAGIIYAIEDTPWAHFVLNWEKCYFMVTEGIVLRHKVSRAGLEVDKAKINNSQKTVNDNPSVWSRKLNDALWAFRIAYKTPIGTTPYRLLYKKTCHLPFEIEHRAYWALRSCNPDLKLAREKRFWKLHELDELRLQAYENSKLYKSRTKAYHDRKLRIQKEFKVGDKVLLYNSKYKFKSPKLGSKWYEPFVVKHGFPSGELYDKHKGSFIVNGHRVKIYHDKEQINELTTEEVHLMCEQGKMEAIPFMAPFPVNYRETTPWVVEKPFIYSVVENTCNEAKLYDLDETDEGIVNGNFLYVKKDPRKVKKRMKKSSFTQSMKNSKSRLEFGRISR
nr:reverse transcriptase domain-containing protein [Tanacetum cinerariifolium]